MTIGSIILAITLTIAILTAGCMSPCPDNYVRGNYGECHLACGQSYCSSNAETCCNGHCVSCSGGTLSADCTCHIPCGSTSCDPNGMFPYCCKGECLSYSTCQNGYKWDSTDCTCHRPCGSSYCTDVNAVCCNGHCVTCSAGYALGSDCQRATNNKCES